LDCLLHYFLLEKKGLLAQVPPLDFPIHPHQPGDYVLIKTWKENKLEPSWEGFFLVLLTMETTIQTTDRGWTHHTLLKKVPSPEGTMDCAFTPRWHQSNLKKTVVKLFFPFHLGNGMFIINITQSTFPLTVEFNACQILPCGELMSPVPRKHFSILWQS
jgi:hypothetical protein